MSIAGLLALGASSAMAGDEFAWTSDDGTITVRAVPAANVWNPDAPGSPACGTVKDVDPATACCRFDFPTCDTNAGNYVAGDNVRFNTYWQESWGGGRYQALWTLGVLPKGFGKPVILHNEAPVDFGDIPSGNWNFCVNAVVQAPAIPGTLNPILEGFAVQTAGGTIPPQGCNQFSIN